MDNNENVDYSEVEEETKEKKKKEKKMSKEEKRISELEEQVATLNEKYLYALAQMKDLHKTYEKENAISVKYVTHDLMLELLPIIDVFSMVLDNPNIPSEVSAYFKGFELVFNQFKDLMERHQVSEINCKIGDMFDYNIHNGVETIETENEEETIYLKVNEEYKEPGYKIVNNNGEDVTNIVEVKVEGEVDVSKKGTYTLTYKFKGPNNEEIQKIRKVIVIDNKLELSLNKTYYTNDNVIINIKAEVEDRINITKNTDKDIAISFSSRYMMDALKTFNEEELLILLNDDSSPIILKSIKDESLIQLILPIKTY